ncbi:hypothetical protein LOAG_13491 [Loa loa]|uniref:Adenosine deaminase domain-containing protein n=1 Tax=Loa loa TaxID=7209 RepID=A0A1S0TJB2_LOALO|nr:hypothetical protein LOAG_13491 [Loa loa]EFO15024.2 hypothetical protein LOAG_13491 [Loa loa]
MAQVMDHANQEISGTSTLDSWNIQTTNDMLLMQIFCRKMPKCEFHAHLSGCISLKMLHMLDLRRRNEYGTDIASDGLNKLSEYNRKPRNLEEAFKLFPLIQQLVVRPEDVTEIYTPTNDIHVEGRICKSVITGVVKSRQLFPNICVRLLLSIDRRQTVEEAEETLNLALRYGKYNDDKATSGVIIGIDISGDPKYDARKFLPLLRKVKNDFPVIAFHLAEVICA